MCQQSGSPRTNTSFPHSQARPNRKCLSGIRDKTPQPAFLLSYLQRSSAIWRHHCDIWTDDQTFISPCLRRPRRGMNSNGGELLINRSIQVCANTLTRRPQWKATDMWLQCVMSKIHIHPARWQRTQQHKHAGINAVSHLLPVAFHHGPHLVQ